MSDGIKLQNQEIFVNDIDSISRYIKGLSYAGHGCLRLYWKICEKKSINARFFINYFPIGSRAFRSKYHLWTRDVDYKAKRWKWIRKILIKLRDMEFVDIEPLKGSPPLALHPKSKFENADYSLKPHISKLIFKFPKQGGENILKEIVAVHKFIMKFVPRHIPPRYYPKSVLEKSFQNKINKAKGVVIIRFPIHPQ